MAAVCDFENSQMPERHKVALRLVDAFILEFGKVPAELAHTARQFFSDAELREIGLKVFQTSSNKISVSLGVDDPENVTEVMGIRYIP